MQLAVDLAQRFIPAFVHERAPESLSLLVLEDGFCRWIAVKEKCNHLIITFFDHVAQFVINFRVELYCAWLGNIGGGDLSGPLPWRTQLRA